MKHSEFEIGKAFRCGGKRYRTTDIGTRVVVAIRIDQTHVAKFSRWGPPIPARVLAVEGNRVSVELRPESDKVLNEVDAEAEGWFNGPPYAVKETVFDEEDIKGCSTEVEIRI